MSERDVAAAIWREIGTLPFVRLFRRHNGDVYLPDKTTRIQVGAPGACDIFGWADGGLHLEIETKSPRGRLSKAQRNFRDVCKRMGVCWVLARSPADVRAALTERGYGGRFNTRADAAAGSTGRRRARLGADAADRDGAADAGLGNGTGGDHGQDPRVGR